MGKQYNFLGNEDGSLLPAQELAGKLGEVQNRFNAVSNPHDAHEAIAGMTSEDVREIFDRCKINDRSTMRIFGASPQQVPLYIVKASAVAIAECESEENPIPSDIEVMVRAHAQEILLERWTHKIRSAANRNL